MRLAIGCDEAAYRLKKVLITYLNDKYDDLEIKDFGAGEGTTVLYPDVAYQVADAVAAGVCERGILVCGTGIGMAICADKVPGIRAAVCHDPFSAERVIGIELAKYLIDIWLGCEFAGGASGPKVNRINELEREHINAAK